MISHSDHVPVPQPDPDESPKPWLKVRRAAHFRDPDEELDKIARTIDTKIVGLNAKILIEERGKFTEAKHFRSWKQYVSDPYIKRRIREGIRESQLKEVRESLEDHFLRENFNMGLYPDETAHGDHAKTLFPIQGDTVLPALNSPYSKQMLIMDVLDQHRKSWEAATRNPIGKRIAKVIPQFVLSRGVKGSSTHEAMDEAWKKFFKKNGMKLRLKNILKELVVFGEVFLRYFNTRDGLVVRSLDPSTIWDVVTAEEDIEDVKYYHQQFVVLHQMPTAYMPGQVVPNSTLIIRQIPAADIDHFKINATSSEKRGRSELYAILPWLLRFKEFSNDRVLLNKMRAMFALDVSVEGGADELASAESQFAVPPGPGAVMIHNAGVTVEYKNANNNANEAKTDAEMLLKIIAVGAGVSENFLGVSYQNTRTGALLNTEPDVKNFEDYREIIEDMLEKAGERVGRAAGVKEAEREMEFTFPSLAAEDRSTKIKDIAFAESMDWITKQRAATMAAREFDISNYNFEEEQQDIRREREDNPVIATGLQQMPKITPDPMALDAAPGLGGDLAPGAGGGGDKQGRAMPHLSAAMGASPKIGGGRNIANTKATLNRPEFNPAKEKAKVKTNRTTGTPTRQSIGDPEGVITTHPELPRRGWGEHARLKSILVRKRRRIERLLSEGAAEDTVKALQSEVEAISARLKEAGVDA